MRILVIRHGDPDYENDTLTELGHRQADALGEMLAGGSIRAVYASPYGRAKDTARYTAQRLSLPIEELPWLREMNDVVVPHRLRSDLAVWNIPPMEMSHLDCAAEHWMENPILQPTLLRSRMAEMEAGTAALLAQYGVACCEDGFTLEKSLAGAGDIAVFCHQGAGLTWIAHLLGLCPIDLWRCGYIAPTSVTTLLLEESGERRGTFRMIAMGEMAHLRQEEIQCSGLLYNRS